MSQVRLARASGVARSQVAAFEGGANVSVSTLERMLREISTLRLDVVPSDFDLDRARREAAELEAHAAAMHAAASRLVATLGALRTKGGGGGAELDVDDATEVSPAHEQKLERLVDEIRKSKAT